jgi:hypothetical protein
MSIIGTPVRRAAVTVKSTVTNPAERRLLQRRAAELAARN